MNSIGVAERSKAVLCLLGPTAAGKTGIAIELCQHYPLEIISVDSALVYRGMDIGTAKPDASMLAQAPHALIDLIEPWQTYSVSRFLTDVEREIERIIEAGRIPLLTGGTMLYFNALWNGLSALPPSDEEVRQKLQGEAEEFGWHELHKRLLQVDAVAAERIHPNDPQRVLRALEVYEISGVPLSTLQNNRLQNRDYDFFDIGIFPQDRSLLHDRIAERFGLMLESGFEAEVRGLMQTPQMHGDLASMRCVGYRQMWNWISGQTSHQEMVDRSLAATRQLAKRQLTWMRRMENLRMLDSSPKLGDLAVNGEFIRWVDKAVNGL